MWARRDDIGRGPGRRSRLVGGLLALAAVFTLTACVFTPTTSVQIKNDTNESVDVATCGSDPVTIPSGEIGVVDPNPNNARAACVITPTENTPQYLGCLLIPTTRYGPKSVVLISQAKNSVPIAKCGDGTR